MGPFNAWPTGSRLRALLRLHRRGDEPVRARDLPRHGPDRAAHDCRGGLPLHGGHDRPGDRLDPAAEGAHARQAVLRLLRPRRHARSAPRAAGVVGQVQGQVRRRLGRAARAHVRAPEGARRDPDRRRADRAPGGDPRLGRHARRPEAGARAPDGGLRRLHGAHRPPRRQAHRRDSPTSRFSRTRSSTTSSATTVPPPKERRTAASTSSSSSTARPGSRPPSSWSRASTTSAPRLPTTTTRSAGRTRWTRRTSGRSRSRRTGAARGTAPSSTGPRASRPVARSARSSTT